MDLERAQTVVTGAQEQPAGAVALGAGGKDVQRFQPLRFRDDVGDRVRREAAGERPKQRPMAREICREALQRLQAERQGPADQLWVVILGIRGRPVRQRVRDGLHRHLAQGAGGKDRKDQAERRCAYDASRGHLPVNTGFAGNHYTPGLPRSFHDRGHDA